MLFQNFWPKYCKLISLNILVSRFAFKNPWNELSIVRLISILKFLHSESRAQFLFIFLLAKLTRIESEHCCPFTDKLWYYSYVHIIITVQRIVRSIYINIDFLFEWEWISTKASILLPQLRSYASFCILFYMFSYKIRFRMQFLGWPFESSVDISTNQRSSMIAYYYSIWVNHWYDMKYDFFS